MLYILCLNPGHDNFLTLLKTVRDNFRFSVMSSEGPGVESVGNLLEDLQYQQFSKCAFRTK